MPATKGAFMVAYSRRRITPELEPGDRVQIWSHGGKPEKYGMVLEVRREHRVIVQLEDGTTINWHKSKCTYYPDDATIAERAKLVLQSRYDVMLRTELKLPIYRETEGAIGPRKAGAEIAEYVDRYEEKRRGKRRHA